MAKVTWRTASADDPIYKEGIRLSSHKTRSSDKSVQEPRAESQQKQAPTAPLPTTDGRD